MNVHRQITKNDHIDSEITILAIMITELIMVLIGFNLRRADLTCNCCSTGLLPLT